MNFAEYYNCKACESKHLNFMTVKSVKTHLVIINRN